MGEKPKVWYIYNIVNKNVRNCKSGPCCAAAHFTYNAFFLLNLPIVSTSQIMVKQQGLKQQKQTNHGAGHEMVKLWCIGTVVVGISML
jgi:hypothetical protein